MVELTTEEVISICQVLFSKWKKRIVFISSIAFYCIRSLFQDFTVPFCRIYVSGSCFSVLWHFTVYLCVPWRTVAFSFVFLSKRAGFMVVVCKAWQWRDGWLYYLHQQFINFPNVKLIPSRYERWDINWNNFLKSIWIYKSLWKL